MSFLRSFKFAARGAAAALKGRNFRFMLCAAAFVIFFAARFYGLSRGEWAAVLAICGSVLALEAVNTAIEALCDKVSEEIDPKIRTAKDCAAGASLIASVFAAAGGFILFWNTERFAEIAEYFSDVPRLIILIAAVAAAAVFVFLPKNNDGT